MIAQPTVQRYYVYAFLNGLQFTWTTWLAYVIARHGNPGWAEAAFHLAILFGEVPTGAIADLFGRRTSMLVGLLLGAAASLSYLWVGGTLSAMVVLGVSGLAGTFLSGADTALLYEAAEAAGGEDLARRAISRAAALQWTALAIGPAVAGALYQWDSRAPFIGSAILRLVTVVVVLGLAEFRQERWSPAARAARRGLLAQTRAAARFVLGNPTALTLVLFSWGYFTVGTLMSQYAQAYFPAAGLTMAATGLVFAAAHLFSMGGSTWTARLTEGGALRMLRFAPLVLALSYLLMGVSGAWLGVGLFTLAAGLDGFLEPLSLHRLNTAIPSEQRATILSLQSAGVSLLVSMAFPAASYLYPVARIYLITGVVATVLALAWVARPWALRAQNADASLVAVGEAGTGG
ncbi:MAG: MFS transporter [Symbiobacteriia bacterium]